MASAEELENYFHRMAQGQFHPNEVNMIQKGNGRSRKSASGLGRSRYSKAMYKISNMVGSGPVTISPVQQGIEQARQMTRLKRGRSGSTSQSSSRKRRKRSKSRKSRAASASKRQKSSKKKKKRKKSSKGGQRQKRRKRRRKTALD